MYRFQRYINHATRLIPTLYITFLKTRISPCVALFLFPLQIDREMLG